MKSGTNLAMLLVLLKKWQFLNGMNADMKFIKT